MSTNCTLLITSLEWKKQTWHFIQVASRIGRNNTFLFRWNRGSRHLQGWLQVTKSNPNNASCFSLDNDYSIASLNEKKTTLGGLANIKEIELDTKNMDGVSKI